MRVRASRNCYECDAAFVPFIKPIQHHGFALAVRTPGSKDLKKDRLPGAFERKCALRRRRGKGRGRFANGKEVIRRRAFGDRRDAAIRNGNADNGTDSDDGYAEPELGCEREGYARARAANERT